MELCLPAGLSNRAHAAIYIYIYIYTCDTVAAHCVTNRVRYIPGCNLFTINSIARHSLPRTCLSATTHEVHSCTQCMRYRRVARDVLLRCDVSGLFDNSLTTTLSLQSTSPPCRCRPSSTRQAGIVLRRKGCTLNWHHFYISNWQLNCHNSHYARKQANKQVSRIAVVWMIQHFRPRTLNCNKFKRRTIVLFNTHGFYNYVTEWKTYNNYNYLLPILEW